MKLGITSLMLATAAAVLAQEVPVVREGAYWVGTIGDSFQAQSSLKVNTHGNVVLRRGTGDQVTYRVQQRVRASSEEQARALLGGGAQRVSRLRGTTVLELLPLSARNVKTDIEISVPPQVSTVIIQTEVGGIEVADFDGGLQLSTGGGEIRLGKIGGSVQCFSGAGKVAIERTGGAINCTTGG